MSLSPSPRSRRPALRQGVWLAAILVVFVSVAAWYSVTTPLGEAPDELPHYTVIRYMAQHGRAPTTAEEHEAFQPPLYYAMAAALTFYIHDLPGVPFAVRANADYDLVDARAPKNLLLHTSAEAWPYRGWALAWHIIRLFSIALAAVTVWAVYKTAAVLFPEQPAIPPALAALTAFIPQFLFVSSTVNNDNLAFALSALVLWRIVALLAQAEPRRLPLESAIVGLLLGLGLLAKASLMAWVPVAGLAMLAAALGERTSPTAAGDRRRRARLVVSCWVCAGLVVAAVAGWYFVRNWRLYGDPLGWSFVLQTNARREGPLTLGILAWLAKGLFQTFWLGWIGIALDAAVYWIIAAACAIGLAGFVAWAARSWRGLAWVTRWALALMGLHVALTLASLLKWTATVMGTDNARLIYPTLPAMMLVQVVGWAWWAKGRARTGVLAGLAGAMLLLAIVTPFRSIMPVHAPSPLATQDELAAARRLDVSWDSIRLLGYRLENSEVKPGGKLALHLYWEASQRTEGDVFALIQLVGQDGKFLMYTDGSPSAGRDTTDRWQSGVPLSSLHLLPVPGYGQPGEYSLAISLHPFGQQTWLTAIGPDGSVIGDRLTLPETIRVTAP